MLRDTIEKCGLDRTQILELIQNSILITCDGDIIATSEECPTGESHIVLKEC